MSNAYEDYTFAYIDWKHYEDHLSDELQALMEEYDISFGEEVELSLTQLGGVCYVDEWFDEEGFRSYLSLCMNKQYPHYLVFDTGSNWCQEEGYMFADTLTRAVSRNYEYTMQMIGTHRKFFEYIDSNHDGSGMVQVIGLSNREYESLQNATFDEVKEFVEEQTKQVSVIYFQEGYEPQTVSISVQDWYRECKKQANLRHPVAIPINDSLVLFCEETNQEIVQNMLSSSWMDWDGLEGNFFLFAIDEEQHIFSFTHETPTNTQERA